MADIGLLRSTPLQDTLAHALALRTPLRTSAPRARARLLIFFFTRRAHAGRGAAALRAARGQPRTALAASAQRALASTSFEAVCMVARVTAAAVAARALWHATPPRPPSPRLRARANAHPPKKNSNGTRNRAFLRAAAPRFNPLSIPPAAFRRPQKPSQKKKNAKRRARTPRARARARGSNAREKHAV